MNPIQKKSDDKSIWKEKETEREAITQVVEESLATFAKQMEYNFKDPIVARQIGEMWSEALMREEGLIPESDEINITDFPAEILIAIYSFVAGKPRNLKDIPSWRSTCKLFNEIFLNQRDFEKKKIEELKSWAIKQAAALLPMVEEKWGAKRGAFLAHQVYVVHLRTQSEVYDSEKFIALLNKKKFATYEDFFNLICIVEMAKARIKQTPEQQTTILAEAREQGQSFLGVCSPMRAHFLVELAKLSGDFSSLYKNRSILEESLQLMVQAHAEVDLKSATEVAYEVYQRNKYSGSKLFAFILQAEIKAGLLIEAMETVRLMQSCDDLHPKLLFLLISKLVDRGNLKAAKAFVTKISDEGFAIRSLIKINEKEGGDLKELLKSRANSLTIETKKLMALLDIARIEGDFTELKTLVKNLPGGLVRDAFMLKIAQTEGKEDFDEVITLCKNHPDSLFHYKLWIQAETSKQTTDFDFKSLITFSEKNLGKEETGKKTDLSIIYGLIAYAFVKKELFNEAKEMIAKIEEPTIQANAYLFLAYQQPTPFHPSRGINPLKNPSLIKNQSLTRNLQFLYELDWSNTCDNLGIDFWDKDDVDLIGWFYNSYIDLFGVD